MKITHKKDQVWSSIHLKDEGYSVSFRDMDDLNNYLNEPDGNPNDIKLKTVIRAMLQEDPTLSITFTDRDCSFTPAVASLVVEAPILVEGELG